MKPIVVSDILAVGEVPSPAEMEILARAGFRSVINNQPDGEVDRLPGSAVLARAAKACGLGYAHAPLASRTPGDAALEAYAEALRDLPAPIYAFCYSGARSAAGCALLRADAEPAQELIAQLAEAGFEAESLRPWLEARHARAAAAGNDHGVRRQAEPAPPAALPSAATPLAAAMQVIIVHPRAMGSGGYAM